MGVISPSGDVVTRIGEPGEVASRIVEELGDTAKLISVSRLGPNRGFFIMKRAAIGDHAIVFVVRHRGFGS